MQIFIDFDYTVFDTNAMRDSLKKNLADFEITAEQYDAAEQAVKEKNGIYRLSDHMEAIAHHHDGKVLLTIAEEMLQDTAPFLYEDVREFVERHLHHELTILSFGDTEWQKMKIHHSGLTEKGMSVEPTDKPKVEYIKQWCADNPEVEAVLINDRGSEIDAIKEVCPQIRTIWIRRKGTPYIDEPCEKADEEYTNLEFTLK